MPKYFSLCYLFTSFKDKHQPNHPKAKIWLLKNVTHFDFRFKHHQKIESALSSELNSLYHSNACLKQCYFKNKIYHFIILLVNLPAIFLRALHDHLQYPPSDLYILLNPLQIETNSVTHLMYICIIIYMVK